METISSTKPKAKKQHTCNWCGGIIEVGDVYERQFLKDDGVYVWKNHTKCSDIAWKLKMFDFCDEGVTEDDFCEFIQEEFNNLHRDKDELFYESEDFVIPPFLEQLDYVCNYHLSGTH